LQPKVSKDVGEIIGDKGLVADEDGFSCSDAGYIINEGYYYNLSYGSGLEAYELLSDLLDKYRDVPQLWDLVGINEEKPRFLYSPLGEIKIDIRKNLKVLEDFCFLTLPEGLTTTVNPEDFVSLPTDFKEIERNLEEKGLNISYTTYQG